MDTPSPILRYFKFDHLPERQQLVSKGFAMLAESIAAMPTFDPAERQTALRKLLEAKDAAVRASLPPRE